MFAWLSRCAALALVLTLSLAPAAHADDDAPASSDHAPLCAVCGHVIGPGKYVTYTNSYIHENYHLQHAQAKHCVYCGRAISEHNTHGGVHYGDGRDVCNICEATAVTDDQTAMAETEKVRARMSAWGLHFNYGAIPVHLVDEPTLARLFGRQMDSRDGKINGLTSKKWVKDQHGKVSERRVSIAVLYGLPATVFEKTIAHELMHTWMFLDKEPEHASELEEGTCNLAAYYYLQARHDDFADFLCDTMYKSPSPAYGEGLRRAVRFVQQNQFNGLVKMLRTHKDFPAGY